MVFMYIFPFPQFLPDPSHPTSFFLFFSSSLPQNRQTNKTPIRQKNNKAKQKRVCVCIHTCTNAQMGSGWIGQQLLKMRLGLECGGYTQRHSIGATDFPFSSRRQLQTASWLGEGFCVHLSFSVLGFCRARTCVGPVCAVIASVSSYV